MQLSQKLSQLFFSTMSHKAYDLGLYQLVNPLVWKVHTRDIVASYKQNTSKNHLEIGVGTGYLIRRANPQQTDFDLTLMDLNIPCLKKSYKRLSKYNPKLVRQNILFRFQGREKRYDSIGLNYVLHCVAGDIGQKSIVFDHIYSVLAKGGVFFGATLLTKGVDRNLAARILMTVFNALGIFNNNYDNITDFSHSLKLRFPEAQIHVRGAAVFWKAIKYK